MPQTIDNIYTIYIDGPFELLIRRLIIDILLDEHFFLNSRAQSYSKHLNWEIPEPNILYICTTPIGPIYSHVIHSFERASKIADTVLEPHGPSMYTLSMPENQAER